MDSTDPKPLRLHKVSKAERDEAQRVAAERLRLLNKCEDLGCLALVFMLIGTVTLWLVASVAGYDLFEWLRY